MKRVIIIGGGFGGFYLAHKLSKSKKIRIILINPKNYFVYTPLIHEVSVGEIPLETVKIYYEKSLKKVLYIKNRVKKILFKEKKIILEDNKQIKYDYLVIATGSRVNDVIKGTENALKLNNLDDAVEIKKILQYLRKKKLKISVIGEGYTGTELMGELGTWAKGNDNIELHHFLYFKGYFLDNPSYDSIIKKRMRGLNVKIHQGEPVSEIRKNEIITKMNTYKSDLTFACTGVIPNVLESDIEFEKGYPINHFCEIRGLESVYAIGDVALTPYMGRFAPNLGQIAEKEGVFVAKDIIRREKGKKRKELKLRIMGIFISVGKFFALGNILDRFKLRGIIGWFMKRTYYILNIFMYKKDLNLIKYYLTSLFFSKRYLK